MIDFLTIVLLIFGVLQIILFFKMWGMTNDIKEMRNKYLKDEDEKEERKRNTIPEINKGIKTDDLKPIINSSILLPNWQLYSRLCFKEFRQL